jgi:hypothetical protein
MRWFARLALPLGLAVMLAVPAGAGAQVVSSNMTHLFNAPGVTGVTNSDLAFWGNRAYVGNYSGFRIFDISNPAAPALVANVVCTAAPGSAGQGDISVWENRLVFRSIDTPQTSPDCSRRATTVVNPALGAVTQTPGWEGLEIYDVSNPAAIRQIAAIATDCGSHTHTLVPDLANNRLIIYVSSYPSQAVSSTPTQYGNVCERGSVPAGHPFPVTPGAEHDKLSIIEVPLSAPQNARVIAKPLYNFQGAFTGVPGFTGCHDITAFLELEIAAGACLTEGVIFDISNPAAPTIQQRLVNPDIDFCARRVPDTANPLCLWHSATFTWDGKYIVFGDENGGGGTNECEATDPPSRGAFWLHRVSSPTFPIASYKIRQAQADPICTAHIMNFVPINDRYVLPSSWYFGGTSVVNWTDVTNPVEIAHYEIQPGTAGQTNTNTWTTYWYNDYVYANDIARGFDVFTLDVPWRTNAWQLRRFNPQTQESVIRCGGPTTVTRLQVGRRAVLRDRLTVLGGQPVVGATVRLRGAGVTMARTTNANGRTVFRFTPRRAGTLRLFAPDTENMLGCEARFRVRAARRGGLAPGGALTGRLA